MAVFTDVSGRLQRTITPRIDGHDAAHEDATFRCLSIQGDQVNASRGRGMKAGMSD